MLIYQIALGANGLADLGAGNTAICRRKPCLNGLCGLRRASQEVGPAKLG
jgi:hypothetical protein